MKPRYLTLLLLPLLISCNGSADSTSDVTSSSDAPKVSENSSLADSSQSSAKPKTPLNELFKEYQKNFTANGTITEVSEAGDESVTTFTTKFTDSSYHYDYTLNGNSGSLDYFKVEENKNSYLGSYTIDKDDKLVLEKIVDEDNNPMSWSYVSNPFLDNEMDASFFSEDNKGNFYLDFSLDSSAAGNRYLACRDMVSKIPLLNVTRFESFIITVKEDRIDSFFIETKQLEDDKGEKFSYEIEFTIDADQSHDHEADKPTVYPHESYHDTLKSAIDYLLTGPYSFSRNVSGVTTAFSHLEGYLSTDLVYYQSTSDNFDGLVLKDGYGHEIIYKNGSYHYDESIKSYDGEAVKDLSDFLPIRQVAIEAFQYDKDKDVYVLKDEATNFTVFFDVFLGLNSGFEDAEKVDEVDVKLNKEKVSSITYKIGKGIINYTYKYDDSLLPFTKDSLTAYDAKDIFYGTFKGTLEGEGSKKGFEVEIKVVKKKNQDKYTSEKEPYLTLVSVALEKKVTEDSSFYVATNVTIFQNTLYFECDGDYTITYGEDDETYSLTYTTDAGVSYTSTLTKQSL